MRLRSVVILGLAVATLIIADSYSARPALAADSLYAGQWLYPGQDRTSFDGVFRLVMQTDGNLVLYHNATPTVAVWHTSTGGIPAIGVTMQTDGNLVIYKQGGGWSWQSNTCCQPSGNHRLVVQDDGNAVIYSAAGPAIWSSNSWAGDHSPEKSRYTDRWYQRLSDSGSYSTWMALSGHRHYGTNMQSLWSGPITNALYGYNNTSQPGGTHTVLIGDYTPATWHDVHIVASANGCFTDTLSIPSTGTSYTPPSPWCTPAEGQIFLFDEGYHDCGAGDCDFIHSRPNTWWFAVAILNNAKVVQVNNTSWFRQAVAAQELGHAIGLDHDGFGDYGTCGLTEGFVRETTMDADCADNFQTARVWDSCGINHLYYDPNWRWTGC